MKTAILEKGMTWKQTTIPPDDAQFLETRGFQVKEIARRFGVPLHLIGDLDGATFSNIEEQGREFVIYTLRPWLIRFEEAINDKLVMRREQPTIFVEFLIDALLRGDTAARYNAYQIGRNGGWLSANDVRELENMNPLKDGQGDIYMVPLNMVPASALTDADQTARSLTVDPASTTTGIAGPGESRSRGTRQRLQSAHVAMLKSAGVKVVRREADKVGRIARRTLPEGVTNTDKFMAEVDEFYEQHHATVVRSMLPALMNLASAINAEAASEIGVEVEDLTPDMEQFIRDYADSLATRLTSSASGQMRELVVLTAIEDLSSVVKQRLGEWEETRPGKVADRESVQMGSAIAKVAWAAGGVKTLVWRASSGHCPLCGEFDGKIVEITKTFAAPGDNVAPGGDTAPMEITKSFGHPPLHEGCDCSIEPGPNRTEE